MWMQGKILRGVFVLERSITYIRNMVAKGAEETL